MANASIVMDEETTDTFGVVLRKRSDRTAIPLDLLHAVLLTVYDQTTAATDRVAALIVPTQDILGTPELRLESITDPAGNAATQLQWDIEPKHTRVRNAALPPGNRETHVAVFELYWSEETSDTLSTPFATTTGSARVVVTDPGHDLALLDHVVFAGCADVGGLDLDGVYVIDELIDSNTYAVNHRSNATATTTGGATPTVFRRPKTQKLIVKLSVIKADIT